MRLARWHAVSTRHLKGLQERDDLKDTLRIAAETQKKLLPKEKPSLPGFAFQAFQQSCYDVGGDFYDFIELDDGRLWLVVADVAGKGYPAALTVANMHAMLHTLASSGQAFDQIPAYTNHALMSILTRGRFRNRFHGRALPKFEYHTLVQCWPYAVSISIKA